MEFDLPALDTVTLSERGKDFPLMDINRPGQPAKRTSDGAPVFITLLGPHSKVYIDITRALVRERVERAAARRDSEAGGGVVASAVDDLQHREDEEIRVLVACTRGWNLQDTNGADIPCTPAAADQLYRSFPEAKAQMLVRLDRPANFTPGPASP